MCLDVGHAHITGTLDALPGRCPTSRSSTCTTISATAARREGRQPSTPCASTSTCLPERDGALEAGRAALAGHPAPLQLEVHPPRPEPLGLATVTSELLASAGCAA